MTANLAEALAAFQAEAPKIPKNKTAKVETRSGGSYSYRYADLGDILPVVTPLLAKHGLSWSSKPGRAADGELILEYRLLHTSGEADAGEMPLGVDRKCKPQELGSAISYARRYALTAQLNLAADEDDDGRTAQNAPKRATTPSKTTADRATTEDVEALKAAAKGLKGAQIEAVLKSCGVQVTHPFNALLSFQAMPQTKTALVCEALSEVKR